MNFCRRTFLRQIANELSRRIAIAPPKKERVRFDRKSNQRQTSTGLADRFRRPKQIPKRLPPGSRLLLCLGQTTDNESAVFVPVSQESRFPVTINATEFCSVDSHFDCLTLGVAGGGAGGPTYEGVKQIKSDSARGKFSPKGPNGPINIEFKPGEASPSMRVCHERKTRSAPRTKTKP